MMALSMLGITAKQEKISVDAQQQEKLSKEFFEEIKKVVLSITPERDNKIKKIINDFIAKGLDVNATGKLVNDKTSEIKDNGSVLQVALMIEDPQVVKSLLKKGAKPTDADFNYAITNKCKMVRVQSAREAEGSMRSFDSTAIEHYQHKCTPTNPELIKLLLDNGAKIDENALISAAEPKKGSSANIKLLVKYGADVNAKDKNDQTPLLATVASRSLESAKTLLDLGADINLLLQDDTLTALFAAVSNRDNDMITLLLDKGADINIRNKTGTTALMIAFLVTLQAITDDPDDTLYNDTFKLLLNRGADITLKKKDLMVLDLVKQMQNDMQNELNRIRARNEKMTDQDVKEYKVIKKVTQETIELLESAQKKSAQLLAQ